eukprot:scaffold487246_cov50-Prasinocladus_malaysianus.AAC.1
MHSQEHPRAPSAPPTDYGHNEFGQADLRAESSMPEHMGNFSHFDRAASHLSPTEAAQAARAALRQEQRRLEWQIRSSHGVRLETSKNGMHAVPIQWADYKRRPSHH